MSQTPLTAPGDVIQPYQWMTNVLWNLLPGSLPTSLNKLWNLLLQCQNEWHERICHERRRKIPRRQATSLQRKVEPVSRKSNGGWHVFLADNGLVTKHQEIYILRLSKQMGQSKHWTLMVGWLRPWCICMGVSSWYVLLFFPPMASLSSHS